MLKSHPGTLFTATFLSLAYIITVSYNLHINPMTWDAFGYYLYLPFTFIYNDISLHNFETVNSIISTYKNTPAFYQAMQLESGNWVFKYSSGMALLYSPFFFIAHLFAKLGGFAADGFSRPYQIAIHLGSLFYTLCGILFSAKILTRFFKDIISSLTLIVVFLGTNYFLHTSMHAQGAMPHNYLFTLYAVLIWCTIKWHEGAGDDCGKTF
jgi:hypothetical protein